MNSHCAQIWNHSLTLSQSYWDLYHRFIGPTKSAFTQAAVATITTNTSIAEHDLEDDNIEAEEEDSGELDGCDVEFEGGDDDDDGDQLVNAEYLEFIKITRKHQAERERLKQLALKKRPNPSELEAYYKDVSQVDTLVEANLVQAPNLSDVKPRQRDEALTNLYGSREAFEKIRSMEMSIDEHFNKKHQDLSPKYWPVMPINPKPYLNPINL